MAHLKGGKTAVGKPSHGETAGGGALDLDELHHLIAVAAYYRAQARSFEPGHELDDWLSAESEILAEVKGLEGFPA
ncbi:MAG TPA: DUF2934 domain-containing protein [Burkholderiales bacterium]|nr:DUF2934 domain-containing protein [Burkholderiales bacterium]